MRNTTKRNASIIFVSCLILSILLSGCMPGREYLADIRIPLEAREGEIVIKEWRFLLGSGAEIYYKNGKNEILLGRLLGGDDGYCPFEAGQYSVAVDGDNLTIKWCQFPSQKDIPWTEQSFELP